MEAVVTFIRNLSHSDVPPEVLEQGKRCLIDCIGVAAGGRELSSTEITISHIQNNFKTGLEHKPCGIFFGTQKASPVGAAYANATIVDAFGASDVNLETGGRIGAVIISTVMSIAHQVQKASGEELLLAIIIGYEISARALLALKCELGLETISPPCVAIGAAAAASRLLKLHSGAVMEALAIAECHSTYGNGGHIPVYPTSMIHAGSNMAAFIATNATLLARRGLTGTSQLFSEGDNVWGDLRKRWRILETKFCLWPCHVFAQPALAAAKHLIETESIDPHKVCGVKVITFDSALALSLSHPRAPEDVQNSIAYPVACMLLKRKFGLDEIDIRNQKLKDSDTKTMASLVEMTYDSYYNERFPGSLSARVVIETNEGQVFESPTMASEAWTRSGVGSLSANDIHAKTKTLLLRRMGEEDADDLIQRLSEIDTISEWISAFDLVFPSSKDKKANA